MWHYLNNNLEYCTCSQAQAVESSEIYFSDITQYAPSKWKTTQDEYYSRDSKTVSCRDSRFGMTLKHSPGTNGEDELMWYRGVSPVRTYLPPEKGKEFQAVDQDCGPKWQGSLARYNPATYSWRTRQCSLLEGLELYSEIFPKWGMMRDGEFSEQTMPELDIDANASGLWPTPDANMGARGTSPEWKPVRDSGQPAQYTINQAVRDKQDSGQLNPDWVEWLMGWPIGWTRMEPIKLDWRDWTSDPADTGKTPRVITNKNDRTNRLKVIGNGQVPAVATLAWQTLAKEISE